MLTVQKCKTTLFVFHTHTVMFYAILFDTSKQEIHF